MRNFAVLKTVLLLPVGKMSRKVIALLVVAVLAGCVPARGGSLALDSIAAWGRFPKLCVDVYRWGDKFFNSYDTTYVEGTGYKFNGKIRSESWFDYYVFDLPENVEMHLRSDASTTIGPYLTYLALSVGYDINVSKLFGGVDRSRSRFRFGFNCSLLAVELYWMKNDVGTTITHFGVDGEGEDVDIPFNGIDTSSWGLDFYYFFNHKKYSQSAAFGFGKIQRKSQGSFYAGFSIYNQRYDFNFDGLPTLMLQYLPESWDGHRYHVSGTNYALRGGYGYNWVFRPGWLLGVSESPIIGLRKGTINNEIDKVSLSIFNRFKMSVVWNSPNGRWFAGAVGSIDVALVNNNKTTFANAVFTGEASFGFRFNIW